jgi:protein O-GlcNAc transferase
VLEKDAGNPQARFLLAAGYEKLGRAAEARTILDGVLKEDPDNLRALIAMAGILAKQGASELTVAICKRALGKDSRNTQAMGLIAEAFMDDDNNAGALPYLQQAVEIQPKLTRNRSNLAACLIGLGRLGEAESELQAILAEHPRFPLVSFNLGLAYEEEGRLEEARAAYAAEVEHNPNAVAARFNLGNMLLRLGDAAGAEAQMRSAIALAPDEPRPHLFLARALLARSGDLDEALGSARDGLERSRTDDLKAFAYYLMADIYSRQGRRAQLDDALAKARYHEGLVRARRAG